MKKAALLRGPLVVPSSCILVDGDELSIGVAESVIVSLLGTSTSGEVGAIEAEFECAVNQSLIAFFLVLSIKSTMVSMVALILNAS